MNQRGGVAESGRAVGVRDAPVLRLRVVQQPPCVWSPLDALLYNIVTTNVVVSVGFVLVAGAAFYFPVRDMTIAVLIVGAFCVAEAVVYAVLVSTMPQNGGDYLFQRRLVSPWVAAPISLAGIVLGGASWLAIASWLASRIVVGPSLVLLGSATRVEPLERLGQYTMAPAGAIVMSLLVIAWSAAVNCMGMRAYARVQRVLMVIGFCAAAVLVAYFALSKLNINYFTTRNVLIRAYLDGFRKQGHVGGFDATLKLLPIVAFGLIYPGWIAFQAAEMRASCSLRVQSVTIVGGKLIGILFALVVLPLLIHHTGEELFAASIYLAENDPRAFWVLAPHLFGSTAAPWLSGVTIAALVLAVNAWFWTWLPNHTLAASRVLLSMSRDRLLPHRLSRLSERQGSPVVAIVWFSVASALLLSLHSYLGIWRVMVHATVLSLITFGVTCGAAALWPFTRRELYRTSTARRLHVLGVPLITVCGLLFAAFSAYLTWTYVRFEPLFERQGIVGSLLVIAAMYTAASAACLLFRRHRLRHDGAEVEIRFRDVDIGRAGLTAPRR